MLLGADDSPVPVYSGQSRGRVCGMVAGMGWVWGTCDGSARFSSLGRQLVPEAGLSLA